tara:strand:- start:119 stop:286 length:168 start_codon:yes stop_codon:yes gene_type:complete
MFVYNFQINSQKQGFIHINLCKSRGNGGIVFGKAKCQGDNPDINPQFCGKLCGWK